MELGLDRRVAFIAGSSRGIGFAIAQAFLREGARVVVTGRDSDSLAAAAGLLGAEAPADRVLAVQADLTNESETRRALGTALETFEGIDVVVANVGSGEARPGWELARNDWESVLNLNLLGGVQLAAAALPHLVARRGNLVMISSIAGVEAIGAPIPYGAAKAALGSAVKSWSRLVGPDGVRVNAVVPGNVLFPGGGWERKLSRKPQFYADYIRDEVPLQRFAKPEEIADAVVFLASERASFITGAAMVIDGGQTRSFG